MKVPKEVTLLLRFKNVRWLQFMQLLVFFFCLFIYFYFYFLSHRYGSCNRKVYGKNSLSMVNQDTSIIEIPKGNCINRKLKCENLQREIT